MDAVAPADAENAPTRDLENRRERGFPQRPHASSISGEGRTARTPSTRLTHEISDTPPGDFSGYLRKANGELKETLECLRDGVDRGYFTDAQIIPLQRLCKRASKAATGLIACLKTATPPNEEPRRRGTSNPSGHRSRREPQNPKEPGEPTEPRAPIEQKPSEPPEPFEPMEPMD